MSVGTTGAADGSLLDAILISSGGNVGIGTAPFFRLDAQGTGSGAAIGFRIGNLSSSNNSSANISMTTAAANTSANFYLNNGGGSPYLQFILGSSVAATYFDVGAISFRNKTASQVNAQISDSGQSIFYGATSSTVYADATSGIGAFSARGSSGNPAAFYLGNTAGTEYARIIGDTSSNLIFSTGSGATERMRVTPSGVRINTTAGGSDAFVLAGVVNNWSAQINSPNSSGSYFHILFNAAGNNCGNISSTSNSTTSFVTTSDRRLKYKDTILTGALSRVAALTMREYEFKADPMGLRHRGCFADEAQKVVPQAVTGKAGAVDADGNIIPQGIDYSKLVPDLWASVQDLLQMVQDNSNRIRNLEVAA